MKKKILVSIFTFLTCSISLWALCIFVRNFIDFVSPVMKGHAYIVGDTFSAVLPFLLIFLCCLFSIGWSIYSTINVFKEEVVNLAALYANFKEQLKEQKAEKNCKKTEKLKSKIKKLESDE